MVLIQRSPFAWVLLDRYRISCLASILANVDFEGHASYLKCAEELYAFCVLFCALVRPSAIAKWSWRAESKAGRTPWGIWRTSGIFGVIFWSYILDVKTEHLTGAEMANRRANALAWVSCEESASWWCSTIFPKIYTANSDRLLISFWKGEHIVVNYDRFLLHCNRLNNEIMFEPFDSGLIVPLLFKQT